MIFPGFVLEHVTTRAGAIRLRRGGSGPPLLLLHGNPQTHAMWHAVAPRLAERFTVDVPGPARLRRLAQARGDARTTLPYAKTRDGQGHGGGDGAAWGIARFLARRRTTAAARVAHRLAIDFPDRVEKLAVLDIVPTIEHFERADMAFGARLLPLVLFHAAPDTPSLRR